MERQIRNAIDAGDGDLPLQRLQARVAAEPDNLQIRLELARTYQQRGNRELAVDHYRLAVQRFPDSAEVRLALAKALRQFGLVSEAAGTLQEFLQAHPGGGPACASWLGILLDEGGRFSDGEQAHRQALARAPALDYLHNNLGYNLLKQDRREEAAAEFRQALALNPHSVVARNNLGLALASQPEQALSNLQAVSDPATAHNNLAAAWIEQGRYAEARKQLDIALEYNRLHTAAWANLQLVARLDGRPAAVHLRPANTRWGRWGGALRRVLIGARPEQSPAAAQVQAGSASNRKGSSDRRGL